MLPWRGSSASCWCVGLLVVCWLPCHRAALLALPSAWWLCAVNGYPALFLLLLLLPPCILSSPTLPACTPSRQVCGSWQGVAAVLQQRPALLFAGDEAVEGLLPEPAQQAMWRVVAAMEGGG